MITSLTKEQESKFPEYAEKWKSYGLSTDRINKPEAQEAINKMYAQAGLKPPITIWTKSPLANPLAKFFLEKLLKRCNSGVVSDSVGASVSASVRSSVWDSVESSVWKSVESSVWDSVESSVGSSVRGSVRDSLGDSLGDSVRASVGDSVRASVSASVRNSMCPFVRASVGTFVEASVRNSMGASVRDSVRASVSASVWASGWVSVSASVWDSCYGQHDADWLACYSFLRNECGLVSQTDKLEGLFQLCKSAGWVLPYENYCFVSDRHYICNVQDGVIHCDGGPAVAYRDGFEIHALWGVRVPKWVAETPYEQLNLEKIMKIENADVRSVALKRFGPERIVEAGYGRVIEDKFLESGYKLIDLASIFKSYDYAPHLYMQNPSIPGLVHCEGVPPDIKTIEQAIRWREDRMNDEFKKVIHT